MLLYVNEIDSPLGKIYLGVSDDKVNYISYDKADFIAQHEAVSDEETPLMHELKVELKQFFKGEIQRFTVPIEVVGTDFQMRVWEALRTIPYGEVVSYKDIAKLAGSPKAVRAVGQANHANPIPIIIPCHRVIQANGKIGGYNGSDIERKQWLLALEMPF